MPGSQHPRNGEDRQLLEPLQILTSAVPPSGAAFFFPLGQLVNSRDTASGSRLSPAASGAVLSFLFGILSRARRQTAKQPGDRPHDSQHEQPVDQQQEERLQEGLLE